MGTSPFRNRHPGAIMIHKVVLVREGGAELVLDTKPKSVCVDTYEDRLKVRLVWDSTELAQDAEEYLAVKNSWPGQESLRLEDRDGNTLFTGKLSGASSGSDEVSLSAVEDDQGPGDLELMVDEDTADPSHMSVLVTVDNHGEGGVALDFGDDSTGTSSGDGSTSVSHLYGAAGTFTVTATDVDQPERTASVEVTVPFSEPVPDMEVSVTADMSDPSGHRAMIVVDNKGAGEVSVSFGDGSADGTNAGDGVASTLHDYADGTHPLVVTDVDQPTRTYSADVVIPFSQG